ncbi:hypothetical protein GCM10022221_29740 [Actinocorallia aurea]
MRIRSISLTAVAALSATLAVPAAAHAGAEDAWRHVYFTPLATPVGDIEAVGPNEVWHAITKLGSLWPTVARWTGGSTWQTYALPGMGVPLLGMTLQDIDAATPDDVWVEGSSLVGILPDRYRKYLAHWDGAKWTKVNAPNSEDAYGSQSGLLEVTSGAAWYFEGDRVYSWNGTGWHLDAELGSRIGALHAFGADSALATTANGLRRWNGAEWSEVPGAWPAAARITGPDSAWYADKDGLHTWDGTDWTTVAYPEEWRQLDTVTMLGAADGLWVRLKESVYFRRLIWRYKDGAWTYQVDTPNTPSSVVVDGAGRVWATDVLTRLMPQGDTYYQESKGRILRLSDNRLSWTVVSSAPEAHYRLIELPGSDRLYAVGRNQWTGTDHITTNVAP